MVLALKLVLAVVVWAALYALVPQGNMWTDALAAIVLAAAVMWFFFGRSGESSGKYGGTGGSQGT